MIEDEVITMPRAVVKCRSCGEDIRWLRTPRGFNIPVDAETTTVDDVDFDADAGHEPHWQSCPFSRRSRQGDDAA